MSETSRLMLVVGVSAAAVVDLRTRTIPNRLSFGLAFAGVLLAGLHLTGVSALAALAGFAAGFLMMLPGYVFGATGAGDVKLFAAVCTFLGPSRGFAAFIWTLSAGGVLALATAVRRGVLSQTLARSAALVRTAGANTSAIEHAESNRFAYAPAIALGALATLLAS